jgi:AAA+ superfamily predicted ATPase
MSNSIILIMNIKKEYDHKSVIQAMNSIYSAAKDSQLEDHCFENTHEEISNVMKYLNTNYRQAVLFSTICISKMMGKNTDISEISNHLNMSSIEFLPYKEDLEIMIKNGLLIRKHNRRHFDDFIRSKSYSIDDNLFYAIIHNLPCPTYKEKKISSTIDVFEQISDLIKLTINDELDKYEMAEEVKNLIDKNDHFPILNHFKSLDIENKYLTILYYLYWKFLTGNSHENTEEVIETLSENNSNRIKVIQAIMSGCDPLSKLDLIELKEGMFMNDMEIHLTENAASILELENITLTINKSKKQRTIGPKDIIEKKLFFNKVEAQNMDQLKSMLTEKNYQSIIQRLSEKKMMQGMNILFYGAPGTGKTESVLQIAKATGREIMKVEISQTKSMWYGESEKIIKRIFRNYETLQRQSKTTPILFFNEADAILGKRKSVDYGNTAQTENAIQNILLEELENFKGIFMATTNLTHNLDKAFDRRFLFKVEFSKPAKEISASIWRSKLPHLSKKDALFLASEFEFSGGQIDNIVRKSEIEYVLRNKKATLEMIVDYCLKEELDKAEKQFGKIGF